MNMLKLKCYNCGTTLGEFGAGDDHSGVVVKCQSCTALNYIANSFICSVCDNPEDYALDSEGAVEADRHKQRETCSIITTDHNGKKCFLQLNGGIFIWNTERSKADEFFDDDLAESIAKSVPTPSNRRANCERTEPYQKRSTGVLQVALYSPSGEYLSTITEMEQALSGTGFSLDTKQTMANDMIAVVRARDDAQTEWLMHQGHIVLYNGCQMANCINISTELILSDEQIDIEAVMNRIDKCPERHAELMEWCEDGLGFTEDAMIWHFLKRNTHVDEEGNLRIALGQGNSGHTTRDIRWVFNFLGKWARKEFTVGIRATNEYDGFESPATIRYKVSPLVEADAI